MENQIIVQLKITQSSIIIMHANIINNYNNPLKYYSLSYGLIIRLHSQVWEK